MTPDPDDCRHPTLEIVPSGPANVYECTECHRWLRIETALIAQLAAEEAIDE